MKSHKQLVREFEKKVKELQSKCKHKKSKWMMSEWAPGHIDDFFVKVCNLCNKTLEKDFDNKSKFKQDLINLILKANDENLEKLRKAYPELVKEFRG